MRDDPKKRLMDAAMAWLREGETPTTRALAERAGVNIAAINYYFQGKDNLLAQALDDAATADMEAWLAGELDDADPVGARLEKLLHFLARIHRHHHAFAHIQVKTLALAGRREHATERALAALQALCQEAHGDAELGRVQGAALMAAMHQLSVFHSQFEGMTGIAVSTPAELHTYVRALLRALDLPGAGS